MKVAGAGTVLAVAVVMLTGAGQVAGASATGPRSQAQYRVRTLPSLGGTTSAGNSINDRGWIAGNSNRRGDHTEHASLWRGGKVLDLGTLGGPNSDVQWPVKNDRGLVAGISQTSRPDPLKEQWSCAAFLPPAKAGPRQCLGFAWRNGVMRPLPTLGGTNGFATGANNRNEIVGWAETRVHDRTCVRPQVRQFRAAVWGPALGEIHALAPLPGDTASAATAINDRDQVAGISGYCDQAVGRFSAIHAVLWQHGRVTPIPTLGGVAWNTPMAINDVGEVVGFANASAADAGSLDPLAFAWTPQHGTRNLHTLPGDVTSQALGINNRGEIVGTSCNAKGHCRAFRWRDGVMTNLNKVIGDGGHDILTAADDINDAGTITGQAIDTRTGRSVAFEATPRS